MKKTITFLAITLAVILSILSISSPGVDGNKKDAKDMSINLYHTCLFALEEERSDGPKSTITDSSDKESIRLLRNATLVVNFGGKKMLVDPMFADKGAFPAFDGAGNDFRNPMVDLPIGYEEIESIADEVDAVFITHTHLDHWDPKAQKTISKNKPIFVQPSDKKLLESQGFTNVTAITDMTVWEGIAIHRTSGQHGFGKVGKLMGKVSGFVFSKAGKKIYIAGDTRWVKEVENAIEEHRPQVIVLNTGGAQFIEGDKKGDAITMTPEDVIAVYKSAPGARILAVHMNTLNHCFVKRTDLKTELDRNGIGSFIEIPEDGDTFFIDQ